MYVSENTEYKSGIKIQGNTE